MSLKLRYVFQKKIKVKFKRWINNNLIMTKISSLVKWDCT